MIDDKEHVKLVEQLFDEKKKLFVEKNSNYGWETSDSKNHR